MPVIMAMDSLAAGSDTTGFATSRGSKCNVQPVNLHLIFQEILDLPLGFSGNTSQKILCRKYLRLLALPHGSQPREAGPPPQGKTCFQDVAKIDLK